LTATGPNTHSGPGSESGTTYTVDPGTYTLSESGGPAGYEASSWVCTGTGTQNGDQIAIANGQSATCTITNTENPDVTQGKIVIRKVTDPASDTTTVFEFTRDYSTSPFSLTGGSSTTPSTLLAGPYSVTENVPSGWDLTGISCSAVVTVGGAPGTSTGTPTANTVSINLVAGDTITCTFTNRKRPTLTLVKTVVNDNGGGLSANDFPRFIDGAPVAWNTAVELTVGPHTASETPQAGYTASAWGGDCAADGSVTLAAGDNKTCTITNDDQQAYITVVKVVTNDDGGSAAPNDFNLTLEGNAVLSGVQVPVNPGTYTAGETLLSGYTFEGFSGDCDANGDTTVALGQSKTCTLTNNDQQAYITVVKVVQNDNGGQAGPDDFNLTLEGNAVSSGVAVPVNPGTYTAGETLVPGYTFQGFSGHCDASGDTTVALGESKTCTLTNSDNPPSLTLVKVVDNTWCGTGCATEASFTLTATGPTGFSGNGPSVSNASSFDAGSYNLSESAVTGYSASAWVCVGGTQNDADTITVGLGQSATCTITNTAIPAQLTVTKLLNPTTDSGLFNLRIDGQAYATDVGHNGTTGAVPVTTGVPHLVSEVAGTGTSLTDYVSAIGGACDSTTGSITLAPGASASCTITNTRKGMVTLHKLTNGAESTMGWNFSLNGPGVSTTDSTPPTTVDFGSAKLVPGETYTVCETGIPAGWTLEWKVDTDNDGIPDTIIPFFAGGNTPPTPWTGYSNVYDPNYVAPPAQYTNDTRCVKFTVQPGQTLAFEINNSFPGGEPRTIGFWKNWNTCTGGRQQQVAAANGGPSEGWYILDDLLNSPGYLVGDLVLDAGDCQQAVRILDKSEIDTGKKMASDGAYNLAAQFLAAMLNLSAGAETCGAVTTAVTNAQTLLDRIGFDGTGAFLRRGADYALANSLASTLDQYNNGNLCTVP
jgi:hypothetical protein